MSLWEEFSADTQFERDYPFGLPCDEWKTKDGRAVKLKEMSENHIKNCMRIVGEDDGWYNVFSKELNRRLVKENEL